MARHLCGLGVPFRLGVRFGCDPQKGGPCQDALEADSVSDGLLADAPLQDSAGEAGLQFDLDADFDCVDRFE